MNRVAFQAVVVMHTKYYHEILDHDNLRNGFSNDMLVLFYVNIKLHGQIPPRTHYGNTDDYGAEEPLARHVPQDARGCG
jgi:hypothetical protein